MNTTDHLHCCRVGEEAGPSDLARADSNANLTNRTNSDCKGAIPKTKPAVKIKPNSSRKSLKLNNNIDDISILNSAVHKDLLQVNGVSLDTNFTSTKTDDRETLISLTKNSDNSNDCKAKLASAYCDTLVSISTENCNGKNKDIRSGYCHLSDDDDDDVLSISDDGCIYTYKGDQDADLPISFFSLDMPIESPNPINRLQSSSPEMDFLEMDFDPGPSSELDFDSSNTNNDVEMKKSQKDEEDKNYEAVPIMKPNTVKLNTIDVEPKSTKTITEVKVRKEDNLDTTLLCKSDTSSERICQEPIKPEVNLNMPWTCGITERTMASSKSTLTRRYHCVKGELVSPIDNSQTSGTSFNTTCVCGKSWLECCCMDDLENSKAKMMFWTEQEAYLKQTTQIGPSACGATAVLNALNALKLPLPSIDKINGCINTRLRANTAPLTQYLLSRSVAGTTHKDIINCLHKVTDGQVYARFFPMYPERVVNLTAWLAFWISKGAVPIATLNLQKSTSGQIPDAWHHQMVFGVTTDGIHLCNPVECVKPELLWPQLCSESILLIRREDVLSRWNIKIDMPELMNIKSARWRNMNVVGQVANLIFESRRELRLGFKNTSHIKIPASYSSGITLAILANSSSCSLLRHCPELPILDPSRQPNPIDPKE